VIRATGCLLFVIGLLIMAYMAWMTVRGVDVEPDDLPALKILVALRRDAACALKSGQTPFSIIVRDDKQGTEARRVVIFRGPDQ
jgi:hypothetical protein